MGIETLLQQLQQRRSRIGLPFDGNVLGDRMDGALDQHAQDRIGVNVALCAGPMGSTWRSLLKDIRP